MRKKRGQIWSVDFVISIVIIFIVIIPALILWQNASIENTEQRTLLSAESDALSITDLMLSTPGVPAGWNSTTVISVGFANEKNILEQQKLIEFNNTAYQKLKNIFGRDFFFELKDINGTVYFTKGTYPPAGRNIIPVQRHGLYNDRIVILDFVLWY